MKKGTENADDRPADARDLISRKELAAKLDISERHLDRLVDASKIPAPIRLGRLQRWRRAEIDAWVEAGCPVSENERIA